MIINESHIRQIVSETVSRLMLEFDMGGAIGRSGNITTADMIDPKELFAEELQMLMDAKKKKQENPNYVINPRHIFGKTRAYKIWQNYYTAMMSKPGKRAVKFPMWLEFVCFGKKGQKIYAYAVDDSYIFGLWIFNHFIAAYFAPVGITGMGKVIRGICQYDNIIFAVTQDLSSMLERLGIPKADTTHAAPWQKKIVTKDVFGTSEKAIRVGFRILDLATAFSK